MKTLIEHAIEILDDTDYLNEKSETQIFFKKQLNKKVKDVDRNSMIAKIVNDMVDYSGDNALGEKETIDRYFNDLKKEVIPIYKQFNNHLMQ
jgi:hypothetical protein